MEIPFNKGTKSDLDGDFRTTLPVNYIAVPADNPYMRSAPGVTKLAELEGVSRGGHWNERLKSHFRVNGSALYSVSANGSFESIGVIPGFGQVSMPYSFNTQAIINDGSLYLYDGTDLKLVTDIDLGAVFDGVWIDGYYWMTDGEFIVISELTDESEVDPLKYGSSEYSPDPIVGVGKTSDNKGIAFNRYTVEYFVNRGTEGFPFQRVAGRAVKGGLVGTHAKCEVAGTYAILGGAKGENVSVHMLGTGRLDKIASREVDEIIKTYSDNELAGSYLESRGEDGHTFVIVHLPNDTLMCDLSTAEWTILKSGALGDDVWRCINGVLDVRSGKWVYGDKLGGYLGELTESASSQYGIIAEGMIYTPIVYLNGVSISEMSIKNLPGRGAIGENPRAFFSMSKNGLTWGQEHSFGLGGRGEYNKQFIVRALGYVEDYFSLRIRIANETPTAFTKMNLEVV